MKRRVNQRGDTIIEVLFSMTIISLVLGISYATVRNSLNDGIAARERTEAVNLIQSQVEILKNAKMSSPDNNAFKAKYRRTGYAFCLNKNADVIDASDAACNQNTQGGNDGDARYHLSTTYTSSGSPTATVQVPGTYHFNASWDRVGGSSEKQNADFYFRL